jgi:cob(I)alamin adenosyltransferase
MMHVARTVCRRAERRLVAMGDAGETPPPARVYLNRLSDLLFVLARTLNRQAGAPDVLWQKDRARGARE